MVGMTIPYVCIVGRDREDAERVPQDTDSGSSGNPKLLDKVRTVIRPDFASSSHRSPAAAQRIFLESHCGKPFAQYRFVSLHTAGVDPDANMRSPRPRCANSHKEVEVWGFEPQTFSLRTRRSTN